MQPRLSGLWGPQPLLLASSVKMGIMGIRVALKTVGPDAVGRSICSAKGHLASALVYCATRATLATPSRRLGSDRSAPIRQSSRHVH